MSNRTKSLAERFEEAYRKPVPYEGLISEWRDIDEIDVASEKEGGTHEEDFARLLSSASRKRILSR